MTLQIDASPFTFTDVNGAVRFSSDGKLFHVLNKVTNSFTIPAYTITQSLGVVNRTDNYIIGACSSLCTHPFGAIFFSRLAGDNSGGAFNRYVTFLGGSAVWLQNGRVSFSNNTNVARNCYQWVSYNVVIINNAVYLQRRILHDEVGGNVNLTIAATGVVCKMEVGAFS